MFKTLLIVTSICVQALFASPMLIGIAGGTGSGKTTMAKKIQDAFPNQSILICQDSYYKDLSHLTMEEKARMNFDHPNSLDFDLLSQHLLDLVRKKPIEQPIYSFITYERDLAT